MQSNKIIAITIMAVTLFTGCQSKPIKTNITQNSTKIVEQEKNRKEGESWTLAIF